MNTFKFILALALFSSWGLLSADDDFNNALPNDKKVNETPVKDSPIHDSPITDTPIKDSPIEVNPQ